MPQLSFIYNLPFSGVAITTNEASVTFTPFDFGDSISFKTINVVMLGSSNTVASSRSFTVNLGLYSITGSSLSLANSVSGSTSFASNSTFRRYLSMTATSATQNITPGTWWFGVLLNGGGSVSASLRGISASRGSNAFPGSFVGGAMTGSTAALPSSVATSDLNITGDNAFPVPTILLTS